MKLIDVTKEYPNIKPCPICKARLVYEGEQTKYNEGGDISLDGKKQFSCHPCAKVWREK